MLRGALKIPGGKTIIKLDIPESLKEMRLNQYIDFLVECRNLDDNDPANSAETMAKAIGAFTGTPIADIIKTEFGVFTGDGIDGTIAGLFGYGLKLISGARTAISLNGSFEYKGETYHVPKIMQQAIAGETILPGLSVIEVIEVAEAARFKNQVVQQRGDPDGKLKKKVEGIFAGLIAEYGDPSGEIAKRSEQVVHAEIEKAGDPDGSMLYTNYLKTLAILCRKEGEHLPVNDSDREAWIQNRMVHFKDIDAESCLGIDFFLTSILQRSGGEMPAIGFLTRQSFAAVAATRLKSAKHGKGRKTTTKKSTKG